MFEDTNQTETLAEDTNPQETGILPFSLFEQEEEDRNLTVKFNGSEQKITLDEAKTLAQKGMNYDHVSEKLRAANRALDALAAQQGILRQELISHTEGEDVHRLRWQGLLGEFPDLDVNTLPAEVFRLVDQGKSPIEAYQSHLIAELREKLNMRENEANSLGSAMSCGEENNDNFLEGFFGAKY